MSGAHKVNPNSCHLKVAVFRTEHPARPAMFSVGPGAGLFPSDSEQGEPRDEPRAEEAAETEAEVEEEIEGEGKGKEEEEEGEGSEGGDEGARAAR